MRALIALPALAGGLGLAQPARADGIENRLARIELLEDGWVLQSEHDVELTPVLVEAVQRGLALWFITELEVTRRRWYWLDQTVVSAQLASRLSYNAMTRQYRLGVGAAAPGHGALTLRFDTLEEALRTLGRVRDWRLGDASLLRHGERYSAALRLRLDQGQLPKPFQLNAITGRDWHIASEWTRFDFVA
ncbi:DUF4390 domain-containing protein [Derxia lacustris]|uniref:DUF4390 domain-containing protein n=1 Tax=Derxia lacustris TaxID=764842 RepID=UPI001C38E0B8|nr:DUF4390 domain-containing protein [Derxia lacustris]